VDWRTHVDSIAWYHTFDLPGGITTPGLFDDRALAAKLPLPRSLKGRRCLDVAASDGFWSFELARRGAEEVVSLDLPDASQQDFWGARGTAEERNGGSGRANQAFAIVKGATGLDVQRVDGSVYDLADMDLGKFDFVFMGNILLHLRDPILALQKVRTVTSGEFFSVEPVSLPQTVLRPFTPTGQFSVGDDNTFWTPNKRGHRRLVEAGGFNVVRQGGPVFQTLGKMTPKFPKRLPRTLHELTFWLFTRQIGSATSWVGARRHDLD